MSMSSFLEVLPEELKKLYIENMIDNGGVIRDEIWDRIEHYISVNYKKVDNYKEAIKMIIKEANPRDVSMIKSTIKCKNPDFFQDNPNEIIDLEDVVNLNGALVRRALEGVDEQIIIKATYIVSPEVISYFHAIYPKIDFMQMREKIGNISIDEAINCNQNVIDQINEKYNSILL